MLDALKSDEIYLYKDIFEKKIKEREVVKMRNRRVLALIITMAMIITSFSQVFAVNEFMDVPSDYWGREAILKATMDGLIQGHNNMYRPNESLTRAEMATIINRAFRPLISVTLDKYTDIDTSDWYFGDMSKAVAMKTFQGYDDRLRPNDFITREEAFVVLSNALKVKADKTDKNFNDLNMVSDWAKESVYGLINEGYVKGFDNMIYPKKAITRAEFAQLMSDVIKNYVRVAGVHKSVEEGNVIINAPNTTLKDLTVKGDLIIAEGVGEGTVILDGVIVTGRLLVRAGGEHSIIIKGDSEIPQIIIVKDGNIVRIYNSDRSLIKEVVVLDGEADVILEGNFKEVRIEADDITVYAINAKIEEVEITGNRSRIIVDRKSKIKKIEVDSSDVIIEGEGEVEEVYVSSNGDKVLITTSRTIIEKSRYAGYVEGSGKVEITNEPYINGETQRDKATPLRSTTPDPDPPAKPKASAITITATVMGQPYEGAELPNEEGVTVTLTTETEDAEVYYTFDGSTPSKTNGTKYTEGFLVKAETTEAVTRTVKAIAVKDGYKDSAVATLEVKFAAEVPKYTVTFSVVGGNGELKAEVESPYPQIESGAEVDEGSDVVFTAKPEEGYQVKEWKVNGVVAEDETGNTYTLENLAAAVNVTVEFEEEEPSTPSGDKAITSFKFEELDPVVEGTINTSNNTIAVEVPYGTDVTALTPTIVHTGDSISPAETGTDFTSPVTYTVTAEDGTFAEYTVTVTFADPVEPDTFKVTLAGDAVKGTDYTISGADDLDEVEDGTELTITAITDITVNGDDVAAEGTKKIAITADTTITINKVDIINIVSFDTIPYIDGGKVSAATYADAVAVIAVLPTSVKANAGTITVPVTGWEDTDNYDPDTSGWYTFTAILGDLPEGVTNTNNETAIVKVFIEVADINIVSFDTIDDIDGGKVGATTYANAGEVITALPTSVKANAGTITVPVTDWEDTDSYNPDTSGYYTFTAKLGDLPEGVTNTNNETATVKVIIDEAEGIFVSPLEQNYYAAGGTLSFTISGLRPNEETRVGMPIYTGAEGWSWASGEHVLTTNMQDKGDGLYWFANTDGDGKLEVSGEVGTGLPYGVLHITLPDYEMNGEPININNPIQLQGTDGQAVYVGELTVADVTITATVMGQPYEGAELPNEEGVTVTLTTETEDAEVYYTFDGSTPSKTNGTKYTEGFLVKAETTEAVTRTVKAIAVKDGYKDSAVATLEVKFAAEVPKYTVTFSVVGGNGELKAEVESPYPQIESGAEVDEGSDVVFTAKPEEGYQVKEWKVNGVVAEDETGNTYTLENLAAAVNVTVEFEEEQNPTIADIDTENAVKDVDVIFGTPENDAIAALVQEIKIKDSNNEDYEVDVTWTIADYNRFQVGEYNATGTFVLPDGVDQTEPETALKVTVKVTVVSMQYASMEAPDGSFDIEVDYGTDEQEAIEQLVDQVKIVSTTGQEEQVSISWTIANYNANKAGDYTATGVLTPLPPGWKGIPANVTATVTVEEVPDVGDTTQLEADIAVAQALHDGATEGTDPGEYAAGSKATLQAAIDDAQAVVDQDNPKATTAEVTQAEADLAEAVATFEAGKVPTPEMVYNDDDGNLTVTVFTEELTGTPQIVESDGLVTKVLYIAEYKDGEDFCAVIAYTKNGSIHVRRYKLHGDTLTAEQIANNDVTGTGGSQVISDISFILDDNNDFHFLYFDKYGDGDGYDRPDLRYYNTISEEVKVIENFYRDYTDTGFGYGAREYMDLADLIINDSGVPAVLYISQGWWREPNVSGGKYYRDYYLILKDPINPSNFVTVAEHSTYGAGSANPFSNVSFYKNGNNFIVEYTFAGTPSTKQYNANLTEVD